MNLTNRTTMKWLLGTVVALVAIAATGTAIARDNGGQAGPDPAAEVLARIGSPRVAAAGAAGGIVAVEARAADRGADSARSLWYGTVAGAAIAEQTGSTTVSRRVLDSAGSAIAEETDAFATGGPSAFAPLDRSEADIVQGARAGARSVGARLHSAHYVRLFGGTAELVVQPDDTAAFLESAGANVTSVLGSLADGKRPYLVTIVGRGNTPLLVVGYTPAVGGGMGQGLGWQAPETASDAIWGATEASHQLP